jgi:hypothetical protein
MISLVSVMQRRVSLAARVDRFTAPMNIVAACPTAPKRETSAMVSSSSALPLVSMLVSHVTERRSVHNYSRRNFSVENSHDKSKVRSSETRYTEGHVMALNHASAHFYLPKACQYISSSTRLWAIG